MVKRSLVLSPALILRSRECVGPCGETKTWGEFYAAAKWPDGTMRRPYPRCKECVRAERRAQPYNPTIEARARHRDRNMLYHRRKRGTPPERYQGHRNRRGSEGRELLRPEPFAAWLRDVKERDGVSFKDLAARFNVSERTVGRIVAGEQLADLMMVERCLLADDVVTLRDVYPDLYEVAA